MSLSSLAPFVAAALRDGAVADVNEELSASQAQVEANKRTQTTMNPVCLCNAESLSEQ